ncbi:hypothetical protein E4U34_004119 [Claviceps purpurea]|nr:hypothetical protein E4U34_004119 [Claviceps purpurea]
MNSTPNKSDLLQDFLQPMSIDLEKCHALSQAFLQTFTQLAAESLDQFLPTPVSESILRPVAKYSRGRHLAIDIGGTNLRVGFVDFSGSDANDAAPNGIEHVRHLRRQLEKSWPIANQLKNDNADSLFLWIGKCIAEVVAEGCQCFNLARNAPLPLGVTFSFPMEQTSLDRAMVTSMGKGFAMPPNVDLGVCLINAYDVHRQIDGTHSLPPVYVAAIANDSVSTLVSFIFHYDGHGQYNGRQDGHQDGHQDGVTHRRAAMGLILGTGSNATIPIKLSMLHPTKRPRNIQGLTDDKAHDVKIAVNTEWSINGTARPMRELGWMTTWDDELSARNEKPGFQPLEYMTAGRYLGELGRIMLLDYWSQTRKTSQACLPCKLLHPEGLTTTFLGHLKPLDKPTLLAKLRTEFPPSPDSGFAWTENDGEALYRIAKAIEMRAAAIIAAATLALLTLGGELPPKDALRASPDGGDECEIGVGYTGGCVVHFQDYLVDCQDMISQLVFRTYGAASRLSVVMSPCHDGGIKGAGILAAAAVSSGGQDGLDGA